MSWLNSARERWGDKFLGVYLMDEPGGNQIDRGYFGGNNITFSGRPVSTFRNVSNYTDASNQYVSAINRTRSMQLLTNTSIPNGLTSKMPVFTSDYALYWFDYKAGYDTVLAEFGWNNSRQMQIALCRGAARANDRDWGAMITWTYRDWPYIESDSQLYDDLVLAYNNGAKYAIIFNYPENSVTQFGILDQKHLDAIKNFWSYQKYNQPTDANYNQVKRAFVMPADYGFGFRYSYDNIWGLWGANDQTQKIWMDTNHLIQQYGTNFDIVFNEPQFQQGFQSRYNRLIYWNQTNY
jgi:hypothetical protein